MTILQRITYFANGISMYSRWMGQDGITNEQMRMWGSLLTSAFDDLQAAMIEYQTGQAPTPLPARTPLTDAWEDPKASMSFLRSLNNDGVSDEYDQEMGLHEALADFKDRDIEPRD